jgi:hypothetical protein
MTGRTELDDAGGGRPCAPAYVDGTLGRPSMPDTRQINPHTQAKRQVRAEREGEGGGGRRVPVCGRGGSEGMVMRDGAGRAAGGRGGRCATLVRTHAGNTENGTTTFPLASTVSSAGGLPAGTTGSSTSGSSDAAGTSTPTQRALVPMEELPAGSRFTAYRRSYEASTAGAVPATPRSVRETTSGDKSSTVLSAGTRGFCSTITRTNNVRQDVGAVSPLLKGRHRTQRRIREKPPFPPPPPTHTIIRECSTFAAPESVACGSSTACQSGRRGNVHKYIMHHTGLATHQCKTDDAAPAGNATGSPATL